MADIARFDAGYFGADRTRVLLSLYQENPKLCFAGYEGSDVVGYVMCRRARRGYKLGPFVCNPKNLGVARELLARSMEKIGPNTAIYSGVPATNEKAVMIFQEFGFKLYSKSIRMRLGKDPATENVSGIFAIGGAMKG
jgi:ribosomal protein S18 acetylase RimI-like enzyme